jgi:membrane AbrB-like protein
MERVHATIERWVYRIVAGSRAGQWLRAPLLGFLLACLASALVSMLLDLVDFPAAWLTGGLLGAAVIVSLRVTVHLPKPAISVAYLVLGALFGSAITAQVMDQMAIWAGTLILCCASLAVTMVASTWYMRRFEGWDIRTAFFASAPGALPVVIAMAEDFSVDQGRVVLSQTVRLFSIMAMVPLLFSAASGAPAASDASHHAMVLSDFLLVSLVAVAGGVFAHLVRLPGGLMVGALISCGFVYAFGIVDTALPLPLQNGAMMLIGMLVGMQLSSLTLASVLPSTRAVLVVLVIGLVIAAATATLAAGLFDIPFEQVLLGYLPGAMEGMTILGFVLGYDPAFISVHHIARFIFVVAMLPVVSRRWRA